MIKICISTCKEYSNKTIPVILDSLLNAGIQREDILVVEGNNKIESFDRDNLTIKANHNSFELTSLIEVCEKEIFSPKWLLLHDTCVVGLNFKQRLVELLKHFSHHDRIALKRHPSMSIGLYNFDFLQNNKNILLKYKLPITKNIDEAKKSKAIAFESEDALLHKLEMGNLGIMGTHCVMQNLDKKLWKMDDIDDRIQEYYPQLDLYKLKGNHEGGKCIVTLKNV